MKPKGDAAETTNATKRKPKDKRASEYHHAKNAARREVGNEARLRLLQRYQQALTVVDELCERVYEDVESPSASDDDLLADGLSSDGEPLRVALALESELVAESIRLAEVGDFTPRSPDDLRKTTAAIMMERGATDYAATVAVYRVRSGEVAGSKERETVRRAITRRRKARPK